ncbi:hypothetical protein DYQ86_15660 [Acidobacteria bacterium AB60]|nr:hypothetical protein DYQ86_15660 [Acidobacteria bacterium AB60]
MPYLRITCPEQALEWKRRIAEPLTAEINELFFNPRAPVTREELRERTTIHFVSYRSGELFIGARTPDDRGTPDITIEVSDWSMSARQQRRIARELTRVVTEVFGLKNLSLDNINVRFHPYPPKDFAVGGVLLSDRISLIGRIMKKLFG